MIKFQPTERCPKCGSMIEIVKYKLGIFGGYIKIKCQTCNYTFKRAPLDRSK